jgi:hypothetical protein
MSLARSALLGILAAISGFAVNVLTPVVSVEGPYPRWLIPAVGGGVLALVVIVTAMLQREPGKGDKATNELLGQLQQHRAMLAQLEARCRAKDHWTASCVEEWGRHQREIDILKETLRRTRLVVADAPIDTAPAPGVGCLMRAALVAKSATALLAFPLFAFSAGYMAPALMPLELRASPSLAARIALLKSPVASSDLSVVPLSTAFSVLTRQPTATVSAARISGTWTPTLLPSDAIASSPVATMVAHPTVLATPTLPPASETPKSAMTPRPTLTAAAVTEVAGAPAPTRALTATPSPSTSVPTPRLGVLGVVPPDGAVFSGRGAVIELSWRMPGHTPAGDEYYLVTLSFPHDDATWYDYQWTRETSIIVPAYLFDLVTGERRFLWRAQLVQLREGGAEGTPGDRVEVLAAMPITREFEWRP